MAFYPLLPKFLVSFEHNSPCACWTQQFPKIQEFICLWFSPTNKKIRCFCSAYNIIYSGRLHYTFFILPLYDCVFPLLPSLPIYFTLINADRCVSLTVQIKFLFSRPISYPLDFIVFLGFCIVPRICLGETCFILFKQ